ncbi:MAG: hypothetical protein HC837_15280 [Chloroflexaceae bacterium]|nr:hypothetical protein [Chloroflexaceae bacterium]
MNKHFKTNYDIPILYFTQMIGLAMGMDPKDVGIGKEFVDAQPALSRITRQATKPPPIAHTDRDRSQPRRPARASGSPAPLPMPRMPKED